MVYFVCRLTVSLSSKVSHRGKGTVISGTLSLGETVQILPSDLEGKVRTLQVYGRSVEKTVAGERAAVNLQGIETSAIERGNVLIRPNTFRPTRLIDAYLDYLPSARDL